MCAVHEWSQDCLQESVLSHHVGHGTELRSQIWQKCLYPLSYLPGPQGNVLYNHL